MKTVLKTNIICTPMDYKIGKHHNWEVQAHLAARNWYQRKGSAWSQEDRKRWIDNWLVNHSFTEQMQVTTCPVCEEAIAEALLNGQDPWKCPPGVKEMLHKYGVAFRQLRSPRLTQIDLDLQSTDAPNPPSKVQSP